MVGLFLRADIAVSFYILYRYIEIGACAVFAAAELCGQYFGAVSIIVLHGGGERTDIAFLARTHTQG
jgi:hypothetical protein